MVRVQSLALTLSEGLPSLGAGKGAALWAEACALGTQKGGKELPKDPLPPTPRNVRPWEEPLRSKLLLLHQQMGPERPTESQGPVPEVEADACGNGRGLVWAAGSGRVIWWAPRPGEQTDTSKPAWLVTRSPFLCWGRGLCQRPG